MIPWSLVAASPIPGGDGELRLMRRGAEVAIFLGRDELMNSRRSGSEEALAVLTCQRLRARARPRLLIGGLGMGFTLRAALGELGPGAWITVAELVPAVVAWARGPMADILAGSLDDPRVGIVERDVGALIRSGNASYDAILLDVDNGPDGLTRGSNDALYGLRGLTAARQALCEGGILSVWSAEPDDDFCARMQKAGFAVEETRVRAHGRNRGPRHVIWIGRRA